MKKKFVSVGIISSLLIVPLTFMVLTSQFSFMRTQGEDDNYSITINAEDITTSTTEVSGSFVAHTDQHNNPIRFNYENIKYQEDNGIKYIVFGQNAWFGNDKDYQIRKIDKFIVYGDNGIFTYNYGWNTQAGSIVYTALDLSSSATGSEISLNNKEPNYFSLMHRNNQADVKVSKIVFKYSKDCTPGEKPAPVLTSITLSGQTTSINRAKAFSFGGTVTAHYDDGSTANVTSSTTFSGYNMAKAGTYTVTASYVESGVTKTATYKLTVNKAWSTVWSGNKKVGDGGVSSFSFGTVAYVSGLQIRSTFSTLSAWCPTEGDSCTTFYTPSNKSSPYTVSSFDSTITNLMRASIQNSSRNNVCFANVGYNKNTGAISASYTCPRTEYGRAQIVVTKIEAYY